MNKKRRNYLINPRFQLKFSFFAAIIMILFSSMYPLAFYDVMSDLIEEFSKVSPDVVEQVDTTKKNLILFFIKWQVVVSLLIFFACIFFSHKIAGPIYKIRKHLNLFLEENQWNPVSLRNGDYFPELADDINRVLSSNENKNSGGLSNIKAVNESLKKISINSPQDRKDALDEIIKKLSKLQKRFDA